MRIHIQHAAAISRQELFSNLHNVRPSHLFMQIGREVYAPDVELWRGFRTPPLIRFVSGEEFYISNTHGGPRMYVNMEDYVSRSTGKPNVEFQRVITLFMQRCSARLHWGKAGWPQHATCFDGAAEYPDSWCHFGCAVQVRALVGGSVRGVAP
jgi:hypothetical protein